MPLHLGFVKSGAEREGIDVTEVETKSSVRRQALEEAFVV